MEEKANEIDRAVLTTDEAAKYLGIAAITLKRMRERGEGPRLVQLSTHRIGYRKPTLDAWLAEQEKAEGFILPARRKKAEQNGGAA